MLLVWHGPTHSFADVIKHFEDIPRRLGRSPSTVLGKETDERKLSAVAKASASVAQSTGGMRLSDYGKMLAAAKQLPDAGLCIQSFQDI
jgi:hypothetical protein